MHDARTDDAPMAASKHGDVAKNGYDAVMNVTPNTVLAEQHR